MRKEHRGKSLFTRFTRALRTEWLRCMLPFSVSLNKVHDSMPGMRNPAHLQANPTRAEMWPAEGYHYRRDHFHESRCFQAALSRFCCIRRAARPLVEPAVGPRLEKESGCPFRARTSA